MALLTIMCFTREFICWCYAVNLQEYDTPQILLHSQNFRSRKMAAVVVDRSACKRSKAAEGVPKPVEVRVIIV